MASPAGRFSGFKAEVRHLGPRIGEPTDEVRRNLLKLAPEKVAELRKKGVIR